MLNRRELLFGAVSTTALDHMAPAAISSAVAPTADRNAPNVLIFMPDQLSGDSILPESPVRKPNLEHFLKQGITFTQAHCPAPHCCPSRASFMSGLYPSEHGVFNNVTTDTAIHPNPVPGTPFWGKALRESGYQMGYAGKLHVGRDITPEDCGFSNISSLEQDSLARNEAVKSPQWNAARATWKTPPQRRSGEILRPDWTNIQLYKTIPDAEYESLNDVKIVRAGCDALKTMVANKKPWCMMISNSGAHDTYDAPKRFVDLYDPAKIKLPASFSDTLNDKPRIYQRQRYQVWGQLSDDEYRDAIRHYYAKCSMQDELFGELLAALDATGQADNTIVLFVSDHGDYAGAHGLWYKGIPSFREAYNIPAAIRWPKGISQPNRRVDAFVDQVDFGPTFLEAAGVPSPQTLSGKSLMPFFKGRQPTDWRDHYCTQTNGVELYYTQRIVTTKDWKYVYNGFDYDELYDLKNDPHEMKNLAFPDLTAKAAQINSGEGLPMNASALFPPLESATDKARRDLLEKMWVFAAEHRDIIFNPYGTVALAPYGPAIGPDPSPSLKTV